MPGLLAAIGRPALAAQFDDAARLLRAASRWTVRRLRRRAAIAVLRNADDAVLWDIGITRSDIPAAVRGEIRPLDHDQQAMRMRPSLLIPRTVRCGQQPIIEALTWN